MLGNFTEECGNVQDTNYDWVRIRKASATQPSVSVGNEQTNSCH